MASFGLNIKLSTGCVMPLDVHKDDSVYKIKQRICQQCELHPESIRIIFQGKQLNNSQILQDFDLGVNTVLHAVIKQVPTINATNASDTELTGGDSVQPIRGKLGKENTEVQSDAESLGSNLESDNRGRTEAETEVEDINDLSLPKDPVSPQKQAYNLYYVYCKPCQKLCSARIRVRCLTCKEGTMELFQEPSCWNDVLKAGRLKGRCLAEGCTGSQAEFYFKCNGHLSNDEQQSLIILPQITDNLDDSPCLTCSAVCHPVLVFPCHPSHVVCIECFIQYCNNELNDRRFVYNAQHGYTLGCPAGCENSLINDGHYFRLLGDEQYQRYQRFATEECLLSEGGVMCPAPGCGEGIFPDNFRRIQCTRPECQFVFCRDCHEAYHESGSCTSNENRQISERYICDPYKESSLSTIIKISKPCPRCKVPTEKDGGCMHMTCSRCSFEWCWLCGVPWSDDCQSNHWFHQYT